jgi:3-oxoacyl-[acyl-carrier-protein] synthase-3
MIGDHDGRKARTKISFRLAGTGVALPRRRVPSAEVDALIGRPAGWTEANFAIAERRWAEGDETSSSMGADAARAALDDAGVKAVDIDVLVGACAVMEQPIPGTAALIQRRLGLGSSGKPAFDVNATCLSFLIALDTVLAGLALGRWRRALIVSSEISSAALDFADPEASVIFGDGAAAAVIEADGPHELLALRLATYGDGADLCRLEAGGTRLRPHEDMATFIAGSRFSMDGHGVFRATAKRFPPFLNALLADAAVSGQELDSVIPHQASAPALEHLKRSIPDGHARTVDIFRQTGNQIAASMPHALHRAKNEGRLATGSHALLIGTSAGISLGGAVIRW